MAAKIQFPLFAPPQLLRSPTGIRFSRWNNSNAQKFVRRDSALTIASNYNPAPPHLTTSKSTGAPSIPGKSSKFSKTPSPHPAFKPPRKIKTPAGENNINFRIDENGVSYEMSEAPFVYQYSYTETPKVKPLKLREPLVSPFGPATMDRPWLGRKPFPPCKKDLPAFDSFQLPPPHEKGVKPVQGPGPYLSGSGPKYVRSREEVLGEPLTEEEIEDLVQGSKKTARQLNIGRDGLTHNMLDNIHGLWKRKRVCRIRCKGVCTVDMDNVCQQLEEKSGGKIIYNRGSVIYLFRGRNYNYKSRPRYPLMLWKPSTPVYPRLVKRVPEGLTLEEATDMRKRGQDLIPICKLGKNGVYCDLVKNVREAFEACELVRINCQGLNQSDYKKIGAKLKDLVPCVLLSFECEHILMWRGRDWNSTMEPNEGLREVKVNVEGLFPSASSLSESKDSEANLPLTYSNEESEGNDETSKAGADETMVKVPESDVTLQNTESRACTEGILLLREEAVENGMAFVFDDRNLDAESVFKMVASFSKTAPIGPVFGKRREQLEVVQENIEQECNDSGREEAGTVLGAEAKAKAVRKNGRKVSRDEKIKEVKAGYVNVVPDGNLRLDELAKLLA